MSGEYLRDGHPVHVTVEPVGDRARIRVDDDEILVESIVASEREVRFVTADGRHHRISVARRGRTTFVAMRGASIEFTPSVGADNDAEAETGFIAEITAPMPGKVLEVLVAEDDEIADGAALLRLEAMKMEQTIRAPADARVREIRVKAGAMVGPGAVLLVLDPLEAASG